MSDGLLKVHELNKRFDGIKALDDFSCSVRKGEILGLIGPNGAGKTTFFNVVSGFLPSESGRIDFKGRDVTNVSPNRITNFGISRTFQNLRLIRQISVLDNVLLSFQDQPGEKLRHVFLSRRRSQNKENENRKEALALLDDTGLAQKANDSAEELSYGQQKLLSLVCCMAMKSDLLLLDEPIAGIAPEMIDRILTIIRGLPEEGKSVILIEHNLDAVMQVCDRVIFMDAGAKVSEGTPEEVRNDPRVIEAYLD
ncbi:ABC transporter ATP-binding protein [bacterium]|nr:ABC transporter ATP-binding protein [bacterium]